MLSIAPINYVLDTTDFSALARMARLPKLYRLVKMFRLLRTLKMAKQSDKMSKQFNSMLRVGVGSERLAFFFLIFFLLCHIVSCFWVIIFAFQEDVTTTWIYKNGFQDLDNFDLYIRAYYFIVTTITTVGFGDITTYNTYEQLF